GLCGEQRKQSAEIFTARRSVSKDNRYPSDRLAFSSHHVLSPTGGVVMKRTMRPMDVLIVVAFIAVLGALLFPTFNQARERARSGAPMKFASPPVPSQTVVAANQGG